MASQYLFTTEELLKLIEASAAMKSLSSEKREEIIKQVQNPYSEKAQRLYQALIKEQRGYKANRKDYLQETSQIMNNLQNEMTVLKNDYLIQKRKQSEAEASKVEAATAEDILKSLNS